MARTYAHGCLPRKEVARVRAPTLVLHSRRDDVVPFKDGIELASVIPGARFVPVDSVNHLWLAGEPTWLRFRQEFEAHSLGRCHLVFALEHHPLAAGADAILLTLVRAHSSALGEG